MATSFLTPQPPVSQPIIDESGRLTPVWRNYIIKVDQVFRQVIFGPLINAANDGAAATAGVPIGGLYKNGSAVQIRVT